jgi:hypothetical protein
MGAALAIENLAVFEKTRRRPWPSSKAAKKNGEKPEDVQKTKRYREVLSLWAVFKVGPPPGGA